MTALFAAHSGLRYLVFVLGMVALALLGIGLVRKTALTKAERIATSLFTGTLHVQALLGFAVLATRPFYPALIGHLVMMLGAALVAQVLVSVNRRRPVADQRLLLVAIGAALTLVVGGVLAIGRSPFASTVAAPVAPTGASTVVDH